MKVHHLSCGTLCPIGGRLVNHSHAKLVCHCLLIETDSSGLVLVDTGFGTEDILDRKRLGPTPGMGGLIYNPNDTALKQIERLGFKAEDVRHILVTHLDMDHVGGIVDFPKAKIHVYELELKAAFERKKFIEQRRYHPIQWSHHPLWQAYSPQGEKWFGFDCVKSLKGLPPEILLIPLVGHTQGHSGIAVKTDSGWLLHAGDAYFHQGEMNVEHPHCPAGLSIFQKMIAVDNQKRLENQRRLRELISLEKSVRVFSAHDPDEYKSLVHQGQETT